MKDTSLPTARSRARSGESLSLLICVATLLFFFVGCSSDDGAPPHRCDELAAHPQDPKKRALGVADQDVDTVRAEGLCTAAVEEFPSTARFRFQLGRALWLGGKFAESIEPLLLAQESDYVAAYLYLGHAYHQGHIPGEPADPEFAHELYALAAAGGLTTTKHPGAEDEEAVSVTSINDDRLVADRDTIVSENPSVEEDPDHSDGRLTSSSTEIRLEQDELESEDRPSSLDDQKQDRKSLVEDRLRQLSSITQAESPAPSTEDREDREDQEDKGEETPVEPPESVEESKPIIQEGPKQTAPIGVTLYREVNYGGLSQHFVADDSNLADDAIGDDSVSSVRLDPGCAAVLFAKPGYRGRSANISTDTPSLKLGWKNRIKQFHRAGNNAVSSIRVDCQ